MNTPIHPFFSRIVLALALVLAAGSGQASVVLTSTQLNTGTDPFTVNLTTFVAPGMNTNVDWVHLLSGGGWFPTGGTPGDFSLGTATPDKAKNVTPLISRTMTLAPIAAGAVSVESFQPDGNYSAVTYSYTDAAGGSPSGSSLFAGLLYNGFSKMTVTVPDTQAYTLSLFGYARFGPILIDSASLSGGGGSLGPTYVGGGVNIYRMDFAFQALSDGQTFTLVFGSGSGGQAELFPAAILSTVPEPGTCALLGLSLVALLAVKKRKA